MSTPVFIIAQQRSGTNLLRRSLATSGRFRDSDEVFDPRRDGFWPFYLEQTKKHPELARPNAVNQIKLLESFLEFHLDNDSPFTLLDVKYNSTHLQDDMWHSPVARSMLINWLIKKQYPVIHLVRDNCLENYVSFLVGTHTQNWVVGSTAQPPKPVKLELDVHHAVFQVKRRQQQIRRFQNDLRNANSLGLTYESLMDSNGHFSTTVSKQICEFLGIKEALAIAVPTKKTGRPLRDVVVNFDSELVPALKANGLGEYVEGDSEKQKSSSATDAIDQTEDTKSIVKVQPFHVLKHVPRVSLPKADCTPVFVLSLQQSGSESLCRGMGKTEQFKDFGRPFNPNQNGYWAFRDEMLAGRPELGVKTRAHQLEIFETYLSECLLSTQTPLAMFDVKYNSSHNLNESWYHRGTRPLFLEWLVEKQHPVIHLVRRNTLNSFFGNWLSANTSTTPVWLNPKHLIQNLKFQQTQIDVFRQWLEPIHSIEITTEPLFGSSICNANGESDCEIARILDHLDTSCEIDVSLDALDPIPSMAARIQNLESEIIPALIENGFEEQVNQSLFGFGKDNFSNETFVAA